VPYIKVGALVECGCPLGKYIGRALFLFSILRTQQLTITDVMAYDINGILQIASSKGQGRVGHSVFPSRGDSVLYLVLFDVVLPLSPRLDALASLLRAWSFSPQFGDPLSAAFVC